MIAIIASPLQEKSKYEQTETEVKLKPEALHFLAPAYQIGLFEARKPPALAAQPKAHMHDS